MKHLPSYYWDASMYFMVLKGETCHGQTTLDAAREIMARVRRGEAIIVSSSIFLVEILPSCTPVDAYERFQAWLQLPNMIIRAVDHPISVKAAELRDRCLQARPKPNQVKIEVADAVHMATALIYQKDIDEVHSVDTDFYQIVGYSGEKITVCKPSLKQTVLDLGQVESDKGKTNG